MTAEPDVVDQIDISAATGATAPEDLAAEHVTSDSDSVAAARRWIVLGAMAAGIVLGVLLAGSLGIGSDIRAGGSTLFAQGSLAQHLASDLSGNGGIGPSFWSKDGVFCRIFVTHPGTASGLSGIACRENGGWRIRIVTETSGAPDLPGSVKAIMANLIVGAALNPDAEQQARKQGWRPR